MTDPYFLQIFQSNMSVCLIISVFCKSSKPICEPEITPVLHHLENLQKSKQKQFHVRDPSCSVFSSQILQNAEINIIMHWKFWRKYGSVSHLFSCINNCKWIQNDFHLIVCGSSSGTLFLKTYYVLQVLFMVNLACCSFLVCFFLHHHIAWKKEKNSVM